MCNCAQNEGKVPVGSSRAVTELLFLAFIFFILSLIESIAAP